MSRESLKRCLRPEDWRRLESVMARDWSLPSDEKGPADLQGRSFGPVTIISLVGPKNNVGSSYFQLYLTDDKGRLSQGPLALGLTNSGRFPAYNWIEFTRYDPEPTFDDKPLGVATTDLEGQLFHWLGKSLPPGGHLMLEYESVTQRETKQLLGLGYPPICTPIGLLLLAAGCMSFRDWYIPEGGREGPRKLQGFKPLDKLKATQRLQSLEIVAVELLSRPTPCPNSPEQRAQLLAKEALTATQSLLDSLEADA